MTAVVLLTAGAVAVFIYGTLQGYELRPALIVYLLLLYVGTQVSLNRWRTRFKAELRTRSAEDRADLLRQGFDGALIDDFVDREIKDWHWAINTALTAIYLTVVPVILSFASRGSLSWDSEVRGVDILVMFAGVATFFAVFKYRVARYQCPSCGQPPVRLEGDALRYHCRPCRTMWYLAS